MKKYEDKDKKYERRIEVEKRQQTFEEIKTTDQKLEKAIMDLQKNYQIKNIQKMAKPIKIKIFKLPSYLEAVVR